MLTVDTQDLPSYLAKQEGSLLFGILDQVRDFVFIKDTDGRFLYNNHAHLENLGRTQDAVRGKNDFDIFPFELASRFFSDETTLFDKGLPIIRVQESIDSRGERFFTSAVKLLVLNTQGRQLGLVGVVHRIASQDAAGLVKEKEEILATLRRLPAITASQIHAFEASLPSRFFDVVRPHPSDPAVESKG